MSISRFELPEHSAQELSRMQHTLNTLRESHRVRINSTEEFSLIESMCRIIVEAGGYRFAWVALVDSGASHGLKPVAAVGLEDHGRDLSSHCDRQDSALMEPVSQALSSGEPVIDTDVLNDPGKSSRHLLAESFGFASSVSIPLFGQGMKVGVLSVYSSRSHAFDAREMQLLEELGEDLVYGILNMRTQTQKSRLEDELQRNLKKIHEAMEMTVQVLATTIEMRDPFTAGHQHRVANLAYLIAEEMDLSKAQKDGVYMAGVIHDLGKMYVPVEILTRPSSLTPFEMKLIKSHPRYGHDVLKETALPWPVSRIVMQHHERMNGSGYPLGLSGEEILIEARVLAVADVIEAMLAQRPYRPAFDLDHALGEIKRNRGKLFDRDVVAACHRLFCDKGYRMDSSQTSALLPS